MAIVVAMAGDEPVSSARVSFGAAADFAGLWGGGTLPQWRGRGIYRALVGYRARLAVARGYLYLQVDASPENRPILERLGFPCLAQTTPTSGRRAEQDRSAPGAAGRPPAPQARSVRSGAELAATRQLCLRSGLYSVPASAGV